jgi:membrane-bound serine protease (ClpP class)
MALVAVGAAGALPGAQAQAPGGAVHVIEITGPIDQGLPPYVERALAEAADADAAAVVLEVDTPGGLLNAALQTQSALTDTPLRTVGYVEGQALSAGALLTIATDEIYLTPASTLGAATPVRGSGEPADEKTVSAVRATFRATAQATGRDPAVAEAMVDPAVTVDGLVGAGELLTLDPQEAKARDYAADIVPDRAAALAAAGLADAEVVETGVSPAESTAQLLTHPVLAWGLVIVALLLLITDLSAGGVGAGAGVAAVLFAVFLWAHAVTGLAGWADIALVVAGLALIAAELLVFPGTGLPGVAGLVAVLGGLFMAQLGRELVTTEQLVQAGFGVAATLAAVLVGLVAAVRTLSRRGPPSALALTARLDGRTEAVARGGGWLRWFGGRDLVLPDDEPAAETPAGGPGTHPAAGDTAPATPSGAGPRGAAPPVDEAEPPPASLAGAAGVALSALRPAGMADIDGERVDVVADGEFIPAGAPIRVLRDEGYRRVVRRTHPSPTDPPAAGDDNGSRPPRPAGDT